MYGAIKCIAFNIRYLIDAREFWLVPPDLVLQIIDKSFEYFVADTQFDSWFLIEKMMEIGGFGTVFDLLEHAKLKAMKDVD